MRRSWVARRSWVLVAVLILSSWFASSLAVSQNAANGQKYGHIVLGDRARAAFAVPAETLQEVTRGVLDSAAKARARLYAQLIDFDETCSRFFVYKDRVVVVMLRAACDLPKMRVADYGAAIMAVAPGGRTIAGPVFEQFGWFEESVPPYRLSADLQHARRSVVRRFKVPE